MKRYIISPEAEQDLDDIKEYLVRAGGIRVARRVLKEIKNAMQFLVREPEAGHRREDLADAPVKFWPVFAYLIVYDPAKRPIEIVRVLHGARDVSTLLGEDR
ncbi:MAG TPA: type II toxin-antitoxin system RelE/ParE family toxin [Chloroflexota bacterium]|nr:type II toxin-antitoxin system RelE/ParE family toxin [Chloroflexota bacterium]